MTSILERSNNDILESFKVINHLFSGVRGALEFYRFLQAFNHRSFDPNVVARFERMASKIDRWGNNLLQGEILFSTTWTAPETFEAQEALSTLEILWADLDQTATSVEQIFRMKTQLGVIDDAQFIVAGVSRVNHARYFFLLNLRDYAPLFGDAQSAQSAEVLLPDSEKGIETAVGIFGYLVQSELIDPAFSLELTEYAAGLPSLLRTQAHETLLLLNYFNSAGITYESIGIEPGERGRWEISGFDPSHAGYWRAQGIPPEEAAAWRLGGITTAAEAAVWIGFRFTPSSATPWAERGFPPAIAAEWAREGYKPNTASAYVAKNVPVPSAIPGRS